MLFRRTHQPPVRTQVGLLANWHTDAPQFGTHSHSSKCSERPSGSCELSSTQIWECESHVDTSNTTRVDPSIICHAKRVQAGAYSMHSGGGGPRAKKFFLLESTAEHYRTAQHAGTIGRPASPGALRKGLKGLPSGSAVLVPTQHRAGPHCYQLTHIGIRSALCSGSISAGSAVCGRVEYLPLLGTCPQDVLAGHTCQQRMRLPYSS
jgi:hypothetical protein